VAWRGARAERSALTAGRANEPTVRRAVAVVGDTAPGVTDADTTGSCFRESRPRRHPTR